jgi:hypothetical protein
MTIVMQVHQFDQGSVPRVSQSDVLTTYMISVMFLSSTAETGVEADGGQRTILMTCGAPTMRKPQSNNSPSLTVLHIFSSTKAKFKLHKSQLLHAKFKVDVRR